MKTGKGPIALSDEARDRVSEQLHARYVATIVGRLREVGTLDLAAADLPIRVVDRPIDDFRTDPSLDLARYVHGLSRRAVVPPRFHRVRFQSRRLYPARRCGGGRPADRPAGRARRVDDRTQRRLPRGTVSRSARLLRPVAARRIRDAHPFGRSRSTLPAAISIGMLPERPIRTGLESSCRGGTASPLSDTRAALPHPCAAAAEERFAAVSVTTQASGPYRAARSVTTPSGPARSRLRAQRRGNLLFLVSIRPRPRRPATRPKPPMPAARRRPPSRGR